MSESAFKFLPGGFSELEGTNAFWPCQFSLMAVAAPTLIRQQGSCITSFRQERNDPETASNILESCFHSTFFHVLMYSHQYQKCYKVESLIILINERTHFMSLSWQCIYEDDFIK